MSSPNTSKTSSASRATGVSDTNWRQEKFSLAVNEALGKISRKEAGANLGELLDICKEIHPDYGTHVKATAYYQQFGKTSFNENFKACVDDSSRQRLARHTEAGWAEIVLSIMNAPANTPYIRAAVPVVNTRMFIMAAVLYAFNEIYRSVPRKKPFADFCYLLIVQLGEELEDAERISYGECLSQNGWDLFRQLKAKHDRNFETGNVSDYPAQKDELSREALAAYIAKRLRFVYNRDIRENERTADKNKYGSFFMHIDGEWGSGKSTLLDFLQSALETPAPPDPQVRSSQFSEGRWVVIKFNAWENQRLDPPWWFLMKTVFRKSIQALWRLSTSGFTQQSEKQGPRAEEPKLRNFLRLVNLLFHEYKWRLYTGGVYLLIAVVTLVLIVMAIRMQITPTQNGTKPTEPSPLDWQKLPIVQLIYLTGFIWSSIKFVRTGLLSGSARAAQSFEQNAKDPMAALSRHFIRLTTRIGHPVAIFIDDLDRCNRDYGIKLLEGLQTIFRSAPVVYVVAADKRWLSAMYESQYSLFAPAVAKPAKPFGTVFLDKTFQYTVELPEISAVQKKLYWAKLLKIKKAGQAEAVTAGQSSMQGHSQASSGDRKENAQKEREEKIRLTSIADEEETMEYKLQGFVELIEPNPRTMKRLINDVSTAINIARLYDQDVGDGELILWTILKLQYPLLAAHYWKNPEAIDKSGASPIDTKLPDAETFTALLQDPSVRRLFTFTVDGEEIKLDSTFLRKMKFQERATNQAQQH